MPEDFNEYTQQQDEENIDLDEMNVEKLRELISEWEKAQTESAKKTLE